MRPWVRALCGGVNEIVNSIGRAWGGSKFVTPRCWHSLLQMVDSEIFLHPLFRVSYKGRGQYLTKNEKT